MTLHSRPDCRPRTPTPAGALDRCARAIVIAALVAMAAAVAGCSSRHASTEEAIRDILVQKWQARYAGMPGGLTLAIVTPQGEYAASTLDGVDGRTHFRGASTTKTFTAAAIMLLEQRGRLFLDDPITANMPGTQEPYLPATPGFAIPFRDAITIRQLLGHRAGVFDVGNNDIPAGVNAPYAGHRYVDWVTDHFGETHTFTVDELIGVVALNQLSRTPPGHAFHYSNTGYSTAAKIVERVSGRSFAQFVRDEFVLPNGLANTTFPDSGATQDLPVPFAEGFTRFGGEIFPTTARNVSWGVGEGNVVTTPLDLARWMRRLLKGEAGVDAARVAAMRDCTPTFEHHVLYGLGISCHPQDLGAGHNGAITGYLTFARHDPAADVTVVVYASLLDADDLEGENDVFIAAAREVRALLGH